MGEELGIALFPRLVDDRFRGRKRSTFSTAAKLRSCFLDLTPDSRRLCCGPTVEGLETLICGDWKHDNVGRAVVLENEGSLLGDREAKNGVKIRGRSVGGSCRVHAQSAPALILVSVG